MRSVLGALLVLTVIACSAFLPVFPASIARAAAPQCPCCGEPNAGPAYYGQDFILTTQILLNQAGYHCPADGLAGKQTQSALEQFQSDYGLEHDGKIGPVTARALSSVAAALTAVTQDVDAENNIQVIINVKKHTVTVMDGNSVKHVFPVGIGKSSTPSPPGEWHVRKKSSGWGGGFGVRFIELDIPWGVYGVHGTNKPYSVGQNLSGGCFRMNNADVLRLYALVEVGTPITVVDPDLGHHFTRPLAPGSRGPDVLLLQRGLVGFGWLEPPADGIYGPKTAEAVRTFQKAFGLKVTGHFEERTRAKARMFFLPTVGGSSSS